MTSEQQTIWRNAIKQTRKITDGFGMPVDKEIVETVTIMQLMGIHTIMSCGGHVRRTTGGPYIMFISQKAKKYAEQLKELGGSSNPLYKKTYKKARIANLNEQQKIYTLLENFYKSHISSFGQRIIVRTVGFSASRLECQSADIAQIAHVDTRKKIVAENRREMKSFTAFLKAEYFKTLAA